MIDCACITACDGDQDGFVSDDLRRARKRHKCCECRRWIDPGERYEYVRGCWEGQWDTYKTCAECAEIRRALFCSWTYSTLWDDLDDWWTPRHSWVDVQWNKIATLDKAARDKLCDWLEERAGEWEDDDE